MSGCRRLSRAPSATPSIYVRTDRIKKPADLKGKKVGLPEYQLTANVWARAILQDDHGVKPSDIHWIRGGIEDADRPEKISIKLPPDVKLEDAPKGNRFPRCSREAQSTAYCAAPEQRGNRLALRRILDLHVGRQFDGIFSGRSASSMPPRTHWMSDGFTP